MQQLEFHQKPLEKKFKVEAFKIKCIRVVIVVVVAVVAFGMDEM